MATRTVGARRPSRPEHTRSEYCIGRFGWELWDECKWGRKKKALWWVDDWVATGDYERTGIASVHLKDRRLVGIVFSSKGIFHVLACDW